MRAPGLWALLAALRAGWCLLPQAGYLHPDEFFQSPEVMAGKAGGAAARGGTGAGQPRGAHMRSAAGMLPAGRERDGPGRSGPPEWRDPEGGTSPAALQRRFRGNMSAAHNI